MWELFLILTVCPLAVGGVTLVYARQDGASFGKALAAAFLAAMTFTGVALWAVNECELAWYLRGELRARLTQEELDTLKGQRLICPTFYSFESKGTRLNAFVLDGWRGAKVYIGTD